jgi:uncharacterized protein (TIGR02679 family)
MISADERLRRVLGGDNLAALRKRLRQRFERAPLDANVETFRIGSLTREEHAALAALLGRPQRYSSSMLVDVRLADAAFQNAGIANSLRNALEQLDGPITHLAATRLQLQALWADVLRGCKHPKLVGLLRSPTGMGLLRRLSKQAPLAAGSLCRRAEAVLMRLPADGMTRSQLAAQALGDAHALDTGRETATLVLAAWRQDPPATYDPADDILIQPTDDQNEEQRSAERDRDVWAKAGVLVNELARPVMFLNLPACGTKSYGASQGEPAYASLRLLMRSPPAWDVARLRVYVCENPNMLAIAADHWGADCSPLVCTDGMPAAAQRCLLAQLAAAQARLCYHGDFDWPGIRIANCVIREHGAEPWRFGVSDYQAAVRANPALGQPLEGKSIEAAWQTELSPIMRRCGIAIPEESVAASLLQDLGNRMCSESRRWGES